MKCQLFLILLFCIALPWIVARVLSDGSPSETMTSESTKGMRSVRNRVSGSDIMKLDRSQSRYQLRRYFQTSNINLLIP